MKFGNFDILNQFKNSGRLRNKLRNLENFDSRLVTN